MEDVRSTYARPYDADYPQVCFDEKLVTLHADGVEPLPMQPGQPARFDHEYERIGTANLFVMVEPLTGYRHVAVTARSGMRQDHLLLEDGIGFQAELLNVYLSR